MKIETPPQLLRLALAPLASFTMAHTQPAEEAWVSLTGEKFTTRPEFAYIKNNSKLPNVLLYRDSISIAYTQRAREQLEGKANVYRLHANGNDSQRFIGKYRRCMTS